MSKIIAAILLFVVLAANITYAADDTKNIAGYGKTVWGMTPDEVINAETPRAEKLEKTAKYLNNLGIVTIKEIKISSVNFRVIFLFDESEQKLVQVNLESIEKNHLINKRLFSNVEQLLTEKYGVPAFREEKSLASWKLAKTSIILSYWDFGKDSFLSVIYRPAAASKNDARDL